MILIVSCNEVNNQKVEEKNQKEDELLFQKQLKSLTTEVEFYDFAALMKSQKKYFQAIEIYDKAIDKFPDNIALILNRGIILGQVGEYEKSINDMNKVISMDSLNPSYIHERGIIYFKANKFNKAITDFSKVVSLKPDFNEAFLNRGFAFNKLGKNIEACQDFQTAYEMGNNQAEEAINVFCSEK